ncbi:MAG: hypothetical protein JWQ89_899 [Devosia sp.]|uniref:hypothetical protein n=1 Tax=Devosia sp. TaxID=1871048 RepID=UPI002608E82A|nr:hypothetical protein [Devosia sp.]MDB5539172.1 hypothetical protein [Devosia sp.]
MRALLFATVLAVGCWGSVAQAADPEITANSIIRAFSDFCDPIAFDRERPAGAQWDADLELNFGRLLFAKYQGNCDRFENAEVAPARATFELLANLPELGATSPRELSADELGLVASALLVEEVLAGGCASTASAIGNLQPLRSLIAGLRQKLTREDAYDLARAYSGNRLIFRAAHGLLPGMKLPTPCEVAPQVAALTIQSAVNLGLLSDDAALPTDHEGMSSEEFERFGQQVTQDAEHSVAKPNASDEDLNDAVVGTGSPGGDPTSEPNDPLLGVSTAEEGEIQINPGDIYNNRELEDACILLGAARDDPDVGVAQMAEWMRNFTDQVQVQVVVSDDLRTSDRVTGWLTLGEDQLGHSISVDLLEADDKSRVRPGARITVTGQISWIDTNNGGDGGLSTCGVGVSAFAIE